MSNLIPNNLKLVKQVSNDDDSQGHIAICESETNGVITPLVVKIPKGICFLIDHEAQILQDLNTLNLPHFCKYYSHSENKIYMEYININNQIVSFDAFLNNFDEIGINLIKQVIMTLAIAQKYLEFTHYDLHCDNILVKEVDKNSVYLYVLDEENQFCVPSNGYCAVIIDYGYAHTKNTYANGSLEFTNLGYTPIIYDKYVDCMRFLITTSRMIRSNNKIYRNIVRNIYPLENIVSMTSGWFQDNICKNIFTILCEKIKNENSSLTNIFYKKPIQTLLLLQSMIVKPIDDKSNHDNITLDYYQCSQEFNKLISNSTPKEQLQLLKKIVNCVKTNSNFNTIEELKNMDFSLFQEYIFNLQKSLSSYINFQIKIIESQKADIYSKIKLKTEQIFGALDFNFKSKFSFDIFTKVYMWKDNKMTEFEIPGKYIKKLNSIASPLKGTYLYDLYKIINKK